MDSRLTLVARQMLWNKTASKLVITGLNFLKERIEGNAPNCVSEQINRHLPHWFCGKHFTGFATYMVMPEIWAEDEQTG
ncbi:hypothetical protein G6M87_21710 [Rhizobium rhizogenes]|uniref:hypothetical protein n=1 Tax=Rhizobium TaxID=379 RepID=UPI001146CCE8|nr:MULTISPECIES: hypothetical protein [Rhizobium]NTI24402.1 hypothetical protein [Rhizobium rhizogenes]NTI43708.1 hypothetical protein [Rhizobium rhizogenes]NTI63683.1 hypothetical protein [Rhizobium rhizogenes]QTG08152.1 hypothetical protein G6M87_21710 [Rhizobium rhizogenes]